MKTDLLTVPGIGKNIKQDLIDLSLIHISEPTRPY